MNKKIKEIDYSFLVQKIEELIIKTNIRLPNDIINELEKHSDNNTYKIILENNLTAIKEKIPLCQDTGISMFHINYGNIKISNNKSIYKAINEGIKNAYSTNILRPSIQDDPINGINTKDNTPGFINIDLTNQESLIIKYLAKGGGSENLSALFMLSPTSSIVDIKNKILEYLKINIINACPPVILGIGIGGTADKAMLNSKKVLFNKLSTRNKNPFYAKFENDLKNDINNFNYGAFGLGEGPTVLDVFIKKEARHIATMPIGLSVLCHSARRGTLIL